MYRGFIALIFVAAQSVFAQATNSIANGDFSQGLVGWTHNLAVNPINVNGEFESEVTTVGNPWSYNLSYGLALKPATNYTLSFRAKSSVARELHAGWGLFHGSWSADVQVIQLTTRWKTFEITGQVSFGADENSRIIFDYGHQLGTVTIDDVVFVGEGLPGLSPAPTVTPTPSATPELAPVITAEPSPSVTPEPTPVLVAQSIAPLQALSSKSVCGVSQLCACQLQDGNVRLLFDSGNTPSAPKFSVGQGAAPSQTVYLASVNATDSDGTLYWFDDLSRSHSGMWFYFNVSASPQYSAAARGDFSYFEYDKLPVCDASTPLPSPTATPETTPSVTPESTPTASPEPAVTVTPEPTPSVTPESTPTTTSEPTPTASPNSTPMVISLVLPMISAEPTRTLTSEPASILRPAVAQEPMYSATPAVAAVRTAETDAQAPSQPQNVFVQNSTATTVYLNWNPSSDNVDVMEYDIYQDGMFVASTERVGFNVELLKQNTEYSFYVQAIDAADNVSVASESVFVTTGADDAVSIFPWVYNDFGNDGAWSWSSTTMSGGSVIEVGSEFNDVKTTDAVSYEGPNAIELHFTHNGVGFASANLFTNDLDPGYEPSSAEQRDAPKDVSGYGFLRFHLMGDVNSNALINLTDTNGVSSRAINISDYSTINSQWQEVRIPLVDFGLTVDARSLQSVNVLVNDLIAAGEWTFYIDKVEFISLTEEFINLNQKVVDQLCGVGAVDSDGDSICDAAEVEFGTDIMNTDTDGDRLSDAAELLGVPGVDLWRMGANPLRSDIFVEMDYYENLRLDPEAIEMVVDAFANAPVANADGSTGIALHIEESDAITGLDLDLDLNPVDTDFEKIKSKYFTPERAGIFHYCLVANGYNDGISSGLSFGVPGTDFVLTMGKWNTPGGTMIQQAGTLMHELGHNLGLNHGGQDNINYKTNYFSVMNYHYQLSGLPMRDGSLVIDFSSYHVNEIGTTFNEFEALSGFNGTTEADLDQFWVKLRENDVTYHLDGSASSNLDYNRNTNIEASAVSNYTPAAQNDWDTLIFSGSRSNPIGDANLAIDMRSYSKASFDVSYETAECITEDHENH